MLNADKPYRWNKDTALSVQQYNDWFMRFAPPTYRMVKEGAMQEVYEILNNMDWLDGLTPTYLFNHQASLSLLRMVCAPPIAQDRLAGLAGLRPSVVDSVESAKRMRGPEATYTRREAIDSILLVIHRLIDRQLCPWYGTGREPTSIEKEIAVSVIADRLCGNKTNPLLRNEQERRQLGKLDAYLKSRGYVAESDLSTTAFDMREGTYAHHKNVRMYKNERDDSDGYVTTPVDLVVMPFGKPRHPVLVECKSAGDAANTNKRRKEEDTKVSQLRATYGDVVLYLFLCGYFEAPYLGYEAANNMDWVWEHRIGDFDEIIPAGRPRR